MAVAPVVQGFWDSPLTRVARADSAMIPRPRGGPRRLSSARGPGAPPLEQGATAFTDQDPELGSPVRARSPAGMAPAPSYRHLAGGSAGIRTR